MRLQFIPTFTRFDRWTHESFTVLVPFRNELSSVTLLLWHPLKSDQCNAMHDDSPCLFPNHANTVSGQPGGVPGDGICRNDRSLHRLRAADPLPRDAGAQSLRARPLQPRPVRRARGLDRSALGRDHHRALLAAGLIPGDQEHPQLHSGRRWRAVRTDLVVVDRQRKALVHGSCHKFGRVGWC